MSISKESLEEVQRQVPKLKHFEVAIRDAITDQAVYDYGQTLARDNYSTLRSYNWSCKQLLTALDNAKGEWVRFLLPLADGNSRVVQLRSTRKRVAVRLEDDDIQVSWDRLHPLLTTAPAEKWLRAAYHALPTVGRIE